MEEEVFSNIASDIDEGRESDSIEKRNNILEEHCYSQNLFEGESPSFGYDNCSISQNDSCNDIEYGESLKKTLKKINTNIFEENIDLFDCSQSIDHDVVKNVKCQNDIIFDMENCKGNNNDPKVSCQDSKEVDKINEVREILEFDYFSKELIKIVCEHSRDNKCDSLSKCTSRKSYGLKTKFCYECENYKYQQFIYSESPNTSEEMGINKASVLGTVNVGIGYTQLMELFASMNIHCMTDNIYRTNQQMVLSILESAATHSMELAAEEERQLFKTMIFTVIFHGLQL